MKNVLIVSGHTDLKNSFANNIILNTLKTRLPHAEQVLLDSLYPDYRIDVAREQQRLMQADVIVLQFPFFWYGMPSLMKKWIEEVFIYGFSHGSRGDKVTGKPLLTSFTSGAAEAMYQYDAAQRYPIEDFLPPFKQFANLCGMRWLEPVYTGSLSYLAKSEAQRHEMRALALAHAERVIQRIEAC